MPSWPLGGVEELSEPITVEDLRNFADLQIGSSEELLKKSIDGAFGRCKQFTGRQLVPLPASSDDGDVSVIRRALVARRFHPIPDARTISEVKADGVIVEPETEDGVGDTGYVFRGHPNEDYDPAPVLELPVPARVVKVTGRFGFDPFPPDLRESVLKLAARGYHHAKALYGDTKEIPDGGFVSYFRQLPPEVQMSWTDYRHEMPIQL